MPFFMSLMLKLLSLESVLLFTLKTVDHFRAVCIFQNMRSHVSQVFFIFMDESNKNLENRQQFCFNCPVVQF